MKNAYNLRAGYGGALYEQTKGTVGAIHELSVSIDLFKRGYSVFRALSPHCKCDLVALKDGELKRIEVRTGVRTKAGKLCYPTKDATTYDILVVVERNTGVLNYFPELTKNPCPAEVNTNPRAISYESST